MLLHDLHSLSANPSTDQAKCSTQGDLRLSVPTVDTCRRVLLARIDPKSEQPFAREFAFDPATVVTRQRQQLVVDMLTIITLLWEDIQRAVEQIETDRSAVVPHFMGAIVLSQIKTYGDQAQAQLSGLSIAIEY